MRPPRPRRTSRSLGRLIVFFDDNDVSIDGPQRPCLLHGRACSNGSNLMAGTSLPPTAIEPGAMTMMPSPMRSRTRREPKRQSLIACKTVIGFGATTHKQGTASALMASRSARMKSRQPREKCSAGTIRHSSSPTSIRSKPGWKLRRHRGRRKRGNPGRSRRFMADGRRDPRKRFEPRTRRAVSADRARPGDRRPRGALPLCWSTKSPIAGQSARRARQVLEVLVPVSARTSSAALPI